MSSSCCCCMTPSGELLEGIRKRERLVRREEEQEEQEEQEERSRRNMDISLLREQYRSTRETQRRRTQVLLFRTVSEELSEAVSVIPVTQGLTSPWEPNSCTPPPVTFDPGLSTGCDPWHVHLGLHRRCHPSVTAQLAASSPETTNTNCSSRRSSTSSETSDPDTGPDTGPSDRSRSRGDPDTGPDTGPSDRSRSRGDPEKVDPGSLNTSCSSGSNVGQSLSDPQERSDETSISPITFITCSPSSSTPSPHADQKENQSSKGVLQTSSTSTWRGSRKFSAPALRFTRQLSVGGVGSTGVHQNQDYHPFPNRRPPRISEAAKRLGMYSSF